MPFRVGNVVLISMTELHGAVNNGNVAIVNAGLNHRVALHFSVKRGFGVAYKVVIEVECLV